MGQTESIFCRDYDFKYKANSDGWPQLDVALIGSCIAPSRLTGNAKARSGGVNNLRGITQDGAQMYKYFIDNGANISLYEFSIPAQPPSLIRDRVEAFIKTPGDNKFLYFSGHGDTDGDIQLGPCRNGEGEPWYVGPSDVFKWMSEAEFGGHITIMVDACHAGKWSHRFFEMMDAGELAGIVSKSHKRSPCKTFINLRLSSLSKETSSDTQYGGSYTRGCLNALRKEWSWTPNQKGSGWGTKVFVNRAPDGKSVLWGTKQSDAQTDIAVDFVILDGRFTWHYPQDRRDYLRQ